jgi:CRISPR/Cas system endoribonuclease Cas6 (RAMP superfamily)
MIVYFQNINSRNRYVQIFALDCVLGERNSLGFGFVNEINTT